LISAICTALDLPQSDLMRIVSDKMLKNEDAPEHRITVAA
ncbi:XRE family transcriptional regulator, partial [Xanthomonas citri pv. citri]|nr:XRE family transcriptional regulator [Xanthomonas citri pv. citri]